MWSKHWKSASRTWPGRRLRTSATPARTARRPCATSRPTATWCWWSARRVLRTPTGWSRWPAATGRAPTWWTAPPTSRPPGWPAPAGSGSRPGPRHPRSWSTGPWTTWPAPGQSSPNNVLQALSTSLSHYHRRSADMGVPLRQTVKVGTYLVRQKLAKREKFPLIVELEPLFACNLECNGCGKIQYPTEILRKRLSVEQAVAAIEESGAPMVSIAGGEPLLHPEIDKMVQALLDRKRFVYLCTNALLMERKLDRFKPHPLFSWVVHIDGLRQRHDESVSRDGVFDKAVAAIKLAKAKGFKVSTNTTFFNTDSPKTVREVLDFLNDELGVDSMMISPGYAYEKAPDQVRFLATNQSTKLFAEAFKGKRGHWRFNHSPLFLDFLEGKVEFECTPWGIPSYSVLGWQRPCYLLADGYTETYKELVETTDWSKYGRGRDPRCRNCMAHCGYEPSAVLATAHSLRQSLRALVNAK